MTTHVSAFRCCSTWTKRAFPKSGKMTSDACSDMAQSHVGNWASARDARAAQNLVGIEALNKRAMFVSTRALRVCLRAATPARTSRDIVPHIVQGFRLYARSGFPERDEGSGRRVP